MSRLLFLAHRIPYPPDKGEKLRAYNILAHLAPRFDIRLGCLIDDPADRDGIDALRRLCGEVAAFEITPRPQRLRALLRARPGRSLMLDYYRHAGLRAWTQAQLQAGPDATFVYTAAMAPYVLGATTAPVILDMVDVDSEKWAMYAAADRLPMRAVWAREARNLLAFERRAAASCAATLLVTEPEVARFAELAPETAARLDYVENGVDLDAFSPARSWPTPFPGPGPHLVFTGTMNYRPNIDAVRWFAAEVMPLLRARRPAPHFWIVGAGPGEEVRQLFAPDVHITGRVPAVQPYLAHADVCVCPLRMARGVQNKVLEAMAMGRPVVASPQAFEGVRAEPGRDLLVADGPAATADSVAAVLDGGHPALGAMARRRMEEGYAWAATLARLDRHLAGVSGRT